MTTPSNSAVQNLLPVQAYFNVDGSFNTFIGQGKPFYATSNPVQSGLTITNSTLDSSPIGATTPSTGAFTSFSTVTGTISTQPSGATDIVNLLALQSYAAGISWKQPCAVATLTNITLSGLQTIDGYTTLAGDRVLVKNQSTAANNGIYIAASGTWTRSSDANTWNELISAISFIEYGTQAGGAWFCTATPGGTIGVTAINWSQFTTSATYTAGTGLTLTGFQFSITNTGVAASTYGSATATPVFAVNAQGQITSVTNTTITPAIGNVTGLATGMLSFLQTPTSANLAATVTDETGSGSLVFNTSPTFITPALGTPASGVLTNATGLPLTTGVTGILPIANGGTGLSSTPANGALDIGNGTNFTRTTLTAGTAIGITNGAGSITIANTGVTSLTAGTGISLSGSTGGVTITNTATMTYPGAGIANSTGSAWGTSYSTTGTGTVVALATSPSFTTPALGTPSAAVLTNATGLPVSTGISGLGTGVATALAVNVGSAGAFVTNGGALGTPSSGVATNLTGTASGLSIGGNAATATSATSATTATTATNATNIAITDNTSSSSTYYPVLSLNTSGNNAATTSSTKLSFVPNTGYLNLSGNFGVGGTSNLASIYAQAAYGGAGCTSIAALGSPQAGFYLRRQASSDTNTNATWCLGVDDVIGAGGSPPLIIGINTSGVGALPRNTSTPVVITAGGYVGINNGLSLPSNPLSVTGTASATTFVGSAYAYTNTVYTSGSGTYTPPTNCKAIWVRIAGGGGGGGGSGTSSATNGGNGGNTTFGSLTANGGTGGQFYANGGLSAQGGSASGGQLNLTGGGAVGLSQNGNLGNAGTNGGENPFGGAGYGGRNTTGGGAGVPNTGAGGGGGGGSGTSGNGAGGGAGGYAESFIPVSGTYSYAVGSGGSGGSGGTGGSPGGGGAAGVIIIQEYYL